VKKDYIMDIGQGKLNRTKDTKYVVSRWYIPGGYEYDKALVLNVFFEDQGLAHEYQRQWEYPPEMADLMDIGRYDHFLAQSAKSYLEYKRRFEADFRNEEPQCSL